MNTQLALPVITVLHMLELRSSRGALSKRSSSDRAVKERSADTLENQQEFKELGQQKYDRLPFQLFWGKDGQSDL